MVSFTCNFCQDVVKKPKVQGHAYTCGSDSFSCVDCMQVFSLDTVKAHTSCVTEEEKYQGKWKHKLNKVSGAKGVNGKSDTTTPYVGIERPPRAPMNDLSSSGDDSDDDWVRGGGSGRNGHDGAAHRKTSTAKGSGGASSKAKAAPLCQSSSRKHPRPGVRPSSSDDEEESNGIDGAAPSAPSAPALKKFRVTSDSFAASVTPSADAHSSSAAAQAFEAAKSSEEIEAIDEVARAVKEVRHSGKRDTPLLLPRSMTSMECVVPSFVLGTSAEVAEIVADILRDGGVSSMSAKKVSLELVARYAKRIAKSVRRGVETAVELGALKMDSEGNVSIS